MLSNLNYYYNNNIDDQIYIITLTNFYIYVYEKCQGRGTRCPLSICPNSSNILKI